MAFPFSVYNIAHLAAGFKSQTHVYSNVIAKAACCPPILLSGDSTFQNTHRNTPQAHSSHFKGMDDNFLSCNTVQARYGANRAENSSVLVFAIVANTANNSHFVAVTTLVGSVFHSSWMKNGTGNSLHPNLGQFVGMIYISVRAGRKITLSGISFVWLRPIVS